MEKPPCNLCPTTTGLTGVVHFDMLLAVIGICPLAAIRNCPEAAKRITECDLWRATAAPDPPYLHPFVTASVRFLGFTVMVTLVWGCLSMLPVP
jgi:hypothetical protein